MAHRARGRLKNQAVQGSSRGRTLWTACLGSSLIKVRLVSGILHCCRCSQGQILGGDSSQAGLSLLCSLRRLRNGTVPARVHVIRGVVPTGEPVTKLWNTDYRPPAGPYETWRLVPTLLSFSILCSCGLSLLPPPALC